MEGSEFPMIVKKPSAARPIDYNATLTQRVDLTSKLSLFRVAPDDSPGYPGGVVPDFQPGQYALIGLNNHADPALGRTIRAYSIASPPEDKNHLEFYIRFVDEVTSANPLTHLLWRLKPGDRIHLGPKISGKFTIAETIGDDDPRIKIFVAAGTGLAPFRSMVRSRLVTPHLGDRMVILHGASYPSDLGYVDELLSLAENNPRFFYWPTISRPKLSPDWKGDCGRVEDFFEADRLGEMERRLGLAAGGLNPSTAVIYICGLTGTIANVLDRALHAGFVPEQRKIREALGLTDEEPSLFFEQYDTTPVVDIKDPAVLDSLLEGTPFAGRNRLVQTGADLG